MDRRCSASALTTVTLAFVVATAAAHAQPPASAPVSCPTINEVHRWLDDVRCLPLDSFPKRLGEGPVEASLGGEARLRTESTDDLVFGLRDSKGEDAFLLRGLLHADVRWGDAVRGFVQLGLTEAEGRRRGSTPIDRSALDLQQAFVELASGIEDGRATLRVGRQELAFGSARLVGVRDGPNLRLAFDGARGAWRRGSLSVDAFAVQPVAPGPDDFDDRADRTTRLYGLYLSTAPPTGTGVDVYYLGYENDHARFDSGSGRERRRSVGLRVFGGRAGWSWDVEGVGQLGRFGARRVAAWTGAAAFGRAFADLPLQPKLTLAVDAASGDKDRSDGELNTFNPLFPRLPYFNEAGFGAPTNFYDLRPAIALRPAKGLVVEASADGFWRQSLQDGVYTSPLVPSISGASSRKRYIGTAYQLRADWALPRHVNLLAALVRFDAGPFVSRAGGVDQTAFISSARFRW